MNHKLNYTATWSVIGVIFSISILAYVNYLSGKNHIDLWTSKSPIRFLSQAHKKLNEDKPYECIVDLQSAVKIIRSIEGYGDSTSNRYLENSVNDLVTIISEIDEKEISLEDLNVAIFETLNAIAYADLKMAEKDIKSGDYEKALVLLKTTRLAVMRSTKYIQPQDTVMEKKVILDLESVLDSLESSQHFDYSEIDQLNQEIEALLERDYLN